jgi:hypothetical protein
MATLTSPQTTDLKGEQETQEIAAEAYMYLYPLVTMDVTRRQVTNAAPGQVVGPGPMMTFPHIRTFRRPTSGMSSAPNFDTLYSVAWLDLTEGPVVLSVPHSGGRYYLLPMLPAPHHRADAAGDCRAAAEAVHALNSNFWYCQDWQGVTVDHLTVLPGKVAGLAVKVTRTLFRRAARGG